MSHWISKALRIARLQSVRQFRQMRDRPMVAALSLLPLVVLVPLAVGRLPLPGYDAIWADPGAYVYGTRLAAGETEAVLSTTRTLAVVLFGVGVYLVALPEASGGGPIDDIDGLLLAVPARSIAVAGILTYVVFTGRLVGVIVLFGAIAFGAGAGSPLVAVTLLFAGFAALLASISLTYPAVLGLKLAFVRYEALRERRTLLGGPLVFALFAVFLAVRRPVEAMGDLPFGWFADLGFVGASAGASTGHALAALFATAVAFVVGTVAATRVGPEYWIAEDPVPAVDESTSGRTRSPVDRLVRRFTSRQTAAVVRVTWRRLRREPKVLMFGGLLIILTLSAGTAAVEQFPDAVPLIVATYGAATVGVGVTLNPLGNEGSMLPATLTVPDGGHHVLVGYALSASIPGGILVGVATLAAGATTSLSLPVIVGLAVLGVALGVAAPFVSLGLGAALPEFDGLDLTENASTQPPRLQAVFFYLMGIVTLGVPAMLGVFAAGDVAASTGADALVVTAAGVGTTLVATAGVAWLSFRYAERKIEGYEVDG